MRLGQPCAQAESGQEAHQRMVNDKLAVAELAATALVALPPLVPLRELADTLRACRLPVRRVRTRGAQSVCLKSWPSCM